MYKLLLPIAIFFLLGACSAPDSKNDKTPKEVTKRIVSLAGTLTEILFSFQEDKNLVGVDITSTFPEKANSLQNLGHVSQLNTEGLIGLNPTHVLAFKDEVSSELVATLKKAKIEVILYEREFSVNGTKKLIEQMGNWLQKEKEATNLKKSLDAEVNTLSKLSFSPKVLFIYARGAGTLMVGGEGTPIEKMIQLAGGKNAATGFQDYKPLTSEAVAAANPDVLLLFDSGAESLGPNGVFNMPGVSLTNAGKNKKLITMDGQFLSGFGPRLGQALEELNQAFSKL